MERGQFRHADTNGGNGDVGGVDSLRGEAKGAHSTASGGAATEEYSIANGVEATATGANSRANGATVTAYGAGSSATGQNATAMAWGATATGVNATAIGPNSSANGVNSTTLGAGANTAGYNNSTAIGAGASGANASTLVAPGITSAASLSAQSGPTNFVTTDATGHLATSTYGPQTSAISMAPWRLSTPVYSSFRGKCRPTNARRGRGAPSPLPA